jgi:hypothetical protein
LRKLSNNEIKAYFLGWQCRIRQLSAREFGGAPLPGMRPRVLTRSGEELMSAMTVLILPKTSSASTAYLKFQAQKTNEISKVYEAGVKFLAESYFQEPELFSDEMTALFQEGSRIAERIRKRGECLLDFEQSSQRFTMFCSVRKLRGSEAAHQATLWHNRIFNPNVPNSAVILGFLPDWKNVHAKPMP